MHALAEIQVIPIGNGVSVRKEVEEAHKMLADAGLTVEAHAFGTNVEGELSKILDAIGKVHAALHDNGITRLSSSIKIGTRSDKAPSLADKRL